MTIAKKFLKKLNESMTVIIVIGIIIAVNILSGQIFWRFDLTQGGNYSISSATKNTIKNLDDVVIIKAYLSKNLPVKYLNIEQEIEDSLEEYKNYSNGKIKVEIIDPSKMDNPSEELGKKNIPTLQFNVVKNDSFQAVNGYLGLSIEHGAKTEVIPVVDSVANLEYDLTLAIKKLAAKEMPVLGVVSSHGAAKMEKMTETYNRLKQIYSIEQVNLKEKTIDEKISALLVIGVKEKIEETELKKIDAFAMKGKPVIFLVDGVVVSPNTGANKNEIGLDQLLTAYGVKINYDLVADISNGRASFSENRGSYYVTNMVNYPLWPKVLPDNFNKDNVIVGGLSSIILPWTSSLEIIDSNNSGVAILAKTTDKAIKQKDNFNLEPNGSAVISGGEGGQYNLAAFITGKIISPFKQGKTDSAKIVIVGDSDFVLDAYIGPASDNLAFFQNTVDSLVLDEDLIKIRSKSASERLINNLSTKKKEAMRYLNIFAVSVLVLIIGFVRYFLRRNGTGIVKEKNLLKLFLKIISLFFKFIFDGFKKIINKIKSFKKAKVVNSVVPPAGSQIENIENKEAYKDIKN